MLVAMMFDISDNHIVEAEQLLIGEKKFDLNERVPFIRNFDTCDLLAVPGSGKTTLLQAKLYCISKHLPFESNKGILVLSHTNNAVNEVKDNLFKVIPQLFEYPNFVGTIQSFINKFLVNPILSIDYKTYININDNKYYEQEAVRFYYSLPQDIKNKLYGRFRNSGRGDTSLQVINFIKYFEINNDQKIVYNNMTMYSDPKKEIYKRLIKWKEDTLKQGLLNFKDSYFLANRAINKIPSLPKLLQKRFQFVFIDEMQDLDDQQIELTENIFIDHDSKTIVQRIGDVNQSIFSNSSNQVDTSWLIRNPLLLTGSNRLTRQNAEIVDHFQLIRNFNELPDTTISVNGLRENKKIIKPHLILFDSNTLNKIEKIFLKIIDEYDLNSEIEAKKYGFHIIGWNTVWKENNHDGKMRLIDLFPNKFSSKVNSNEKPTLSLFINLIFKNEQLSITTNLIELFLYILRLAYDIGASKNTESEKYNRTIFMNYISGLDVVESEMYYKNLYLITKYFNINKSRKFIYEKLKSFIKDEFSRIFRFEINLKIQEFLQQEYSEDFDVVYQSELNKDKINFHSVHSVKGKTHCATLYIETAYQRPTYETQKVIKNGSNPFLKRSKKYTGTYDRQAMKMMYVGFSRPTHLLCFACFKNNIKDELNDYKIADWEIIDLTEEH
jgi:hypothetical protein